jgi:hypothetical protein
MPALPGAPTSELGVINPDLVNLPPNLTGSGRMWTTSALQVDDDLPEVTWPGSITIYRKMSRTAQISGLQRAVFLAATRRHWVLKPRPGVSEQAMLKMSDDFGIPIDGVDQQKERLRTRDRFMWRNFLRLALMAVTRYGHYDFEQIGRIDDEGWWRMDGLEPRPPRTIQNFYTDVDGKLVSIEQNTYPIKTIPVNRLVRFVWDQEDGSFVGESMLRELYIPWLKLDRLNRTDVARHERSGAGIPMVELPEGAGLADYAEGMRVAQGVRVGQYTGGVLKNGAKLHLVGVDGAMTDVLASIKHEEELMARAWMAMIIQLGQTQTGSRALGSEFTDWWNDGIDAICHWLREIFQAYMVEDWIDFNLGENAEAPELKFTTPDPELAVTDLVQLIQANVIRVDDTLEHTIRDSHNLPPQTGEVRLPPEGLKPPPAPTGGETSSIQVRNARLASGAASGPLRRQLNDLELSAGFDPVGLDAAWQRAVQEAVEAMKAGRAEQIAELGEAVRKAGSQAALAAVQASPRPADDLASVFASAGADGVTSTVNEAQRQGASIPGVPAEQLTAFSRDRAAAVQRLVANGLSRAASSKALTLSACRRNAGRRRRGRVAPQRALRVVATRSSRRRSHGCSERGTLRGDEQAPAEVDLRIRDPRHELLRALSSARWPRVRVAGRRPRRLPDWRVQGLPRRRAVPRDGGGGVVTAIARQAGRLEPAA